MKKSIKNKIRNLLDVSERPDGLGKNMEDIDGLFTSNYIFASKNIKDKVVLDNGCGSGYGAAYLAEKGASKVFATDYHKKTIKLCSQVYHKDNLFFRCMDGVDLSFPDNYFDAVTSFEVLEHIKEYEKYLKECRRVLKERGSMVLSTPNKEKFSPGSKDPIIVSHFKEFTYSELVKLLGKYFKDVEIYGKHITSEEYKRKENSTTYKGRTKIVKRLASMGIIRKISCFIPSSIRSIITGSINCKLSMGDIKISKDNIEEAKEFLAVCTK